jgi:hypothetical protein
MASSSSANFQSIFNASLQAYDNKTKDKLLDHPLATHLQSCDSPNAVRTVLQDLVNQFDQRRASDERSNSWLNPTVNVLCAFSDTLGDGVSLVSPNSLSLYDICSDHHSPGIPPWEGDIYGDWCTSLGERPCRSHSTGEHDAALLRPQRMRMQDRTCSLTSLSASGDFSSVSSLTQNGHHRRQ